MTNKQDLKNTFDEVQDKAVEKAEQFKSKAQDKAREIQDTASAYIKNHPFKSVGIGVLAGIGLSMLLSWNK